ncbi:MAG: helix-turn-helix transcriptional regulator [Ancalomicrobiaceae bacterium]|nr:helix-turn-helix transcriptional regulator [Ancalomicrobiaceae bacterium]
MRTSAVGQVFNNAERAKAVGFFGSEFYHDWIRPQDDIGRALGVVLSRDEAGLWFLAGHLPFGQEGSLAETTFATIEALTPLLVRAARLSTQMAAEASAYAPAAALLDQLVSAVCCVDRKGRLVYANLAGERLIKQGDVVRTGVDGRMRFIDPAAEIAYANARLCGGREAVGQGTQFFAVPSPLRDRILSVAVTPYQPRARTGFAARSGDEGTTLVMITDPNAMPVPPIALLRQTYGLTPAEASVAEQLAAGLTPQDIAEGGGIKTSTVRSQMKALMVKMGAKRQSDVVRIVLGLAGGFNLGRTRMAP